MMILPSSVPNAHASRGAALVVSLVLIGALMLLGITAVMLSNTQLKIAGNTQYHSAAVADAESAVALAEGWVLANREDPGFTATTVPGLYHADVKVDPLTMTWDDTTSIRADASGNQRYIIQILMLRRSPHGQSENCEETYLTHCQWINSYRITARGTNRVGATAYVESIYALDPTEK